MADPLNPTPGGNRPDWGRNQVDPAKRTAPVGDSTRWGATLVQSVEADSVQHVYQSEQFIACAARDSYSRPWSLAGTVEMPFALSSLNDANDDLLVGLGEWAMYLAIVMGVGQTQITHIINVRATIAAQQSFYSTPLHVMFGGLPTGRRDTFPFVIGADALIGNTIGIRIITAVRLAPFPALYPAIFPITTNVIVTPFAAGTEL
jgi:hypothetical protein